MKEFKIKYIRENFLVETDFLCSDTFRDELNLILNEGVFDNSEIALCETIIYLILKEVWKVYRRNFRLWSHQSLIYDEKLSGIPDYILAKRYPLGVVVFDLNYNVLTVNYHGKSRKNKHRYLLIYLCLSAFICG